MSTLGKVLIVLVLLSLLGWIFLASLVADHNANWSKRRADVEAEVATLTSELPPLVDQIRVSTDEASLWQVSLDRAYRNFRADVAMAQKTESDTKEALSRYTLQLAQAQQEAAAAQARRDLRAQERFDLDKQIAQEESGVRDLTAENQALKKQLADLRQTFIATVAQNKTYTERLAKPSPGATGAPRTRLGSLAR